MPKAEVEAVPKAIFNSHPTNLEVRDTASEFPAWPRFEQNTTQRREWEGRKKLSTGL